MGPVSQAAPMTLLQLLSPAAPIVSLPPFPVGFQPKFSLPFSSYPHTEMEFTKMIEPVQMQFNALTWEHLSRTPPPPGGSWPHTFFSSPNCHLAPQVAEYHFCYSLQFQTIPMFPNFNDLSRACTFPHGDIRIAGNHASNRSVSFLFFQQSFCIHPLHSEVGFSTW